MDESKQQEEEEKRRRSSDRRTTNVFTGEGEVLGEMRKGGELADCLMALNSNPALRLIQSSGS